MLREKWAFKLLILLLILLGTSAQIRNYAFAQEPKRQTTIIVPYTEYEWWLLIWDENEIVCQVFVDHEGLPTPEEVLADCGGEVYLQWLNTPPCTVVEGSSEPISCSGIYLHFVSSQPKQREVIVDLPPATVELTLQNCTPSPPTNLCTVQPELLFTGIEPLPNEQITAIRGSIDGLPFRCEGSVCALTLTTTPLAGSQVEFWAISSFGDTSPVFTAYVRVVETGVQPTPGGSGWFVDVISTQWRGAQVASCSDIWEAFPPLGGVPEWLANPTQPELLATDRAYFYLAGRLIAQGVVDASACPQGGLLPNGYADACGLEKARPAVEAWQNQFDPPIIAAAQEHGVPSQLLKNLFAQESQFWPGEFRVRWEFGLGQLTDNGTDAILLWNEAFYDQFCPLVLHEDSCAGGYFKLSTQDQAMLRGALAGSIKADCPECPTGVDLTTTNISTNLFAQTLKANCEQVGQLVLTATERRPGSIASYEDLWRMTIANYHAGPGCVSFAIHTAWNSGAGLSWPSVAANFTEFCQSVIPYVDNITNINTPIP
jgi:hypothetical protein